MAGVYERDGEWWPVPQPVPLVLVVRGALLNALAYTNGHHAQAATLLGLSARQMSYQLRRYHIPHKARQARLRRAPRPAALKAWRTRQADAGAANGRRGLSVPVVVARRAARR